MRTSVGSFIGSPEQLNLLQEQQTNNFLIGRGVRHEVWKPETVTVPTFKNHPAAGYRVLNALSRNISKPNERILSGGELQNLELKDYATAFKIQRRYMDVMRQMSSQSNNGGTFESLVTSMYLNAAISSYAVTGEALLNSVIDNNNNFDPTHIIPLTTEVDKSTDADELIQTVLSVLKRQSVIAGGANYIDDTKVSEGKNTSPFKIVVPLSVAQALASLTKVFNITIPYSGLGNTGNARVPTPELLSQIFSGADVIVPQGIKASKDVVYYEESAPNFIFEGNYIGVLYSHPDKIRPSSLVYHSTPLETEDDTDIFEKEIKMYQRAEVEIKAPETMFKITNILSPALYNLFAKGI